MKISGYMTCRNASQMGYPFIEALESLRPFCDEIVVCDSSDGTDDTSERLEKFAAHEHYKDDVSHNVCIRITHPEDIDWDAPNHGIYDGITKAKAREVCTGDYCFQIDADEVVSATREQIETCANELTNEMPLQALPVVEYWGSKGKVRIDVNPWKERLSINDPNITHGIPGQLRKHVDGLLYAHHGTDGCNVIYKDSLVPVPCMQFVKPKVEQVRRLAIKDSQYVPTYEKWFNGVVDKLPTIYHFSWWSVYEKMLKYKLFWNNSWISLYNEARPEGYNPFFNKPFSEVSEQEMRVEARKIEEHTAGHIFHQPWDGGKTNHVTINKPMPALIENWANEHKTF